MFDNLCRWLYWKVWLLMPGEEEFMANLTTEQREQLNHFKNMMGV